MSVRLENETIEQYKARLLQEEKDREALLKGQFLLKTHSINRDVKRRLKQQIPQDDAVIISKIAELCGDTMPLDALRLLYLDTPPCDRHEMIESYLNIIREDITTPTEK